MYNDIARQLGGRITDIYRFRSGFAGETSRITLEDGRIFVVKSYGSDTCDLKREWEGLRLLTEVDYPVPTPVLAEFEGKTPYIVISCFNGDNLWDVYCSTDEATKKQLLISFSNALATLHRIDTTPFATAVKADFIGQELTYINSRLSSNNQLEPIYEWLSLHKPQIKGETPAVLHRDYHPWNVLVGQDNKLCVIDWVWGVGDARFDLAWTFCLLKRSGYEGFAKEFLQQYNRISGYDLSEFDYFKVLATVRWIVNVKASLDTGENVNKENEKEFRQMLLGFIEKGLSEINQIIGVGLQGCIRGYNV